MKKIIKKVDMWTETGKDTILIEGAIIDGFASGNFPYDKINVVFNLVGGFG